MCLRAHTASGITEEESVDLPDVDVGSRVGGSDTGWDAEGGEAGTSTTIPLPGVVFSLRASTILSSTTAFFSSLNISWTAERIQVCQI